MFFDQIFFVLFLSVFFAVTFLKTYKSFIKPLCRKPTHLEVKPRAPESFTPQELEKLEKEKKRQKLMEFVRIGVSVYSSFNSLMVFIGLISETFLYGAKMYSNFFAVTIAYVFVGITIQPFMYDLDKSITSPYMYLEKRYNCKYVRIVVAMIGAFFYISFMSLFICAGGCIMSTLFSDYLPIWQSEIILGVFSLFGGIMGGYTQSVKMVLFQFLLFFVGTSTAVFITFAGNKQKTAAELWEIADRYGRRNFIDTSTDFITRYTILSQVFSLPIPWCSMHSLLLHSYQKYRAIDTKIKSRLFLVSNIPVMWLFNTVVFFGGIACFVYFYACDPRLTGEITNKNQLASLWFVKSLGEYLPAFAGICLSGIVCFGIITHSSGLHICTVTIMNEVLAPLNINKIYKNSPKLTLVVKSVICTLFGGFSIIYSISFLYTKRTVLALFFMFSNSLNSPILGVFLLSMFNPYANRFGAIFAFCSCVCINFWVGMSSIRYAKLISQEMNGGSFACTKNISQSVLASFTQAPDDYYPKNPTVFFIYSINPIWYCAWSVICVNTLGTIASFVFSIVTTRSLDCDSHMKKERKKYLYSFRKNFLHIYDDKE